ncbi:MAG: DUF502 domain-containing protein [Candidatus Bipolaricaulia bacterium]
MLKDFLIRIRNIFIRGLLVILPIAITLYILWFIYRFVNNIVGPDTYLGRTLRTNLAWIPEVWIPWIGLLGALIIIMFIGLLTRNYLGRKLNELFDWIIETTPLVNKLYSLTKQLTNALLDRDISAFKKAVLFEYPRRGCYTLGLLTSEELGALNNAVGERSVAVFAPTAPNPLSGWVLIIPEKDIIYLDISVEEAMRLVLSGGVAIPRRLVEIEDGQAQVRKEGKGKQKERWGWFRNRTESRSREIE